MLPMLVINSFDFSLHGLNSTVSCERGVFGQGGPDSSVGGVPVCNCLDDDHMEEEVQIRVQVETEREEQGKGERHGKEQGEEQRVKERTTAPRG